MWHELYDFQLQLHNAAVPIIQYKQKQDDNHRFSLLEVSEYHANDVLNEIWTGSAAIHDKLMSIANCFGTYSANTRCFPWSSMLI